MPKLTSRNPCTSIPLAVTAVGLAIAGCTKEKTDPFQPRLMQQAEILAPVGTPPISGPGLPESVAPAERNAPATPLPTLTMSSRPPLVDRPIVPITLQEAVARAVVGNNDVRVASYEPAIDQTRVVEAEARFDPTFFAQVQAQDQKNINLTLPSFGQFNDSNQFIRSQQAQAGLRQNLASGGQAEVRFGTQQIDRDNAGGSSTNPYWLNDLTLQLTQPLLRDFGNDVNGARIRIARNQQQISLLEFRQTLEENIENVERAYWQLVQATRELQAARTLLSGSDETVARLRGREEATLQISQAASSSASRRAIVVRAEARVADLSDQLKRLMNDPDYPVASPAVLEPASPPLEQAVLFSLEDQVRTAMEYRPELGQQQLRIDSATEASAVARNNIQPQLNFVGATSLQVAGDSFVGAFEDNNGNPENDFYDSWSAGLNFEVPIGNRAARSVLRRATLQRQQAIDSYAGLVSQVSLEVKLALREVETTWNEIAQTREARFYAADALAAINQLDRAGGFLSANEIQLQLDRQAALAQAESAEAQAVANYNQAISRLERSKGTLLRYNNVEIAEEAMPPLR